MQKWAYPADYLRTYSTDFDQTFIFDKHVGGMIILTLLEITHGTLPW